MLPHPGVDVPGSRLRARPAARLALPVTGECDPKRRILLARGRAKPRSAINRDAAGISAGFCQVEWRGILQEPANVAGELDRAAAPAHPCLNAADRMMPPSTTGDSMSARSSRLTTCAADSVHAMAPSHSRKRRPGETAARCRSRTGRTCDPDSNRRRSEQPGCPFGRSVSTSASSLRAMRNPCSGSSLSSSARRKARRTIAFRARCSARGENVCELGLVFEVVESRSS